MEGRPHIVDLIKSDDVTFIVNTTEGRQAISDSFSIRREALQHKLTYSTTISGALAIVHALDFMDIDAVYSLKELHSELIGSNGLSAIENRTLQMSKEARL